MLTKSNLHKPTVGFCQHSLFPRARAKLRNELLVAKADANGAQDFVRVITQLLPPTVIVGLLVNSFSTVRDFKGDSRVLSLQLDELKKENAKLLEFKENTKNEFKDLDKNLKIRLWHIENYSKDCKKKIEAVENYIE